jgi:cell division protein ZapA
MTAGSQQSSTDLAEKPPMSHVTVTINGRQYRMACDDGQQDHLAQLAVDLDRRVNQLRANFGEIGDNRLLVMAALTISDQLSEAQRRIGRLEGELSAVRDTRAAVSDRSHASQAVVAAALNAAAERIERVTKGLNRSLGGEIAIG